MIRLSIVIATYNRAENLIRTLESLLRQSLPASEWEAVVVNNNSSDDTEERFREFAAAHSAFNLRIVQETKQGLSHARNAGITASRGEYIAIIDDDEEVNESFGRAYIDFFDRHPDVAACGGKITPLYEYEVPKWLSSYAERPIAGTLNLGEKTVPFTGEKYPGGGNMGVRRSVLEKYGAFNPELGRTGKQLLAGEEKDLFRRLATAGEKIYYLPEAEILHIIPQQKLTPAYFDRLTKMVGVSERVRTRNISRKAYWKRLGAELVKWGGTGVLATGYLLNGHPTKGWYLFKMRWNITLGLLGLVRNRS